MNCRVFFSQGNIYFDRLAFVAFHQNLKKKDNMGRYVESGGSLNFKVVCGSCGKNNLSIVQYINFHVKKNDFTFTSNWLSLRVTALPIFARIFIYSLRCPPSKNLRDNCNLWKTFSHKWSLCFQVWLKEKKDTMGGRSGRGRKNALQMLLQLRSVVRIVFSCAHGISTHAYLFAPQK